jgi:hypothetical protein
MGESLNNYLRLAEEHLHAELISPEALAHIRKIARLLPPVSASGFECRLGEQAPRADLGLRFWPPERGPEYLAGLDAGGASLPAFLLEAPAWRRIRRFGARWADPASSLYREIKDIFLEFDVDGAPAETPIPAFFLDFHKHAANRLETLQEAVEILWGESLAAPVRRQLLRCLDVLPEGAVLYSMGAMFSRAFHGVRLHFHYMESRDMPDYLSRAGWSGSLRAIEELLAWMPSGLTLCIDVGEQILPRVGVQYHIDENMKSSTPRWIEFLDMLVDRGLCLPAKRDGLVSWCGHLHERSHREVWPETLTRLSRRLGGNVMSVFLRMINHVKVSYQPGQPLEAKAYLGLVQTWLRYDQQRGRYILDELPGEDRQPLQAAGDHA